uniref:Uncharacterized protein n=1 Tax=Oryza glumipatula TaxID=40148 RepID=A0A0E0BFV3_9ORYZ
MSSSSISSVQVFDDAGAGTGRMAAEGGARAAAAAAGEDADELERGAAAGGTNGSVAVKQRKHRRDVAGGASRWKETRMTWQADVSEVTARCWRRRRRVLVVDLEFADVLEHHRPPWVAAYLRLGFHGPRLADLDEFD